MAANPLRDSGNPAWQIISLILTAVGVVIAIIALPDNTRAVGIVTGVLGIGACAIFAARLGRARATNTSTQGEKSPISSAEIPTHSSPQSVGTSAISKPPSHETDSSQANNLQYGRDTTNIVRSHLLYALLMNIVLLVMIGIYFSLFGNINHWGSVVFLVLILSFLISLIYFILKISQATLHNIVKARVIFAYALAIFVVTISLRKTITSPKIVE